MYVAICSDDLWLAVICQTNLEIAGSPRKVYRDRLLAKRSWGRALNGASRVTEMSQSNSRIQLQEPKGNRRAGLSSCVERETTQTFS